MFYFLFFFYSDIPIDTFVHSFTDFFFFSWLKQDLAANFWKMNARKDNICLKKP